MSPKAWGSQELPVILKSVVVAPVRSKKRKAFIIDAQEDEAARMHVLLTQHNFELVKWFPSGAGWVAEWEKAKPEMVIVDYTLPKRDGLFCLERLRELSVHCLTVFTHSFQGAAANDLELKALARGAFAVFQKPGTDARLACILRRCQIECHKIQTLRKLKPT